MQEEIIQKGNGRDCRRHVLKGYNEMKGRSPFCAFQQVSEATDRLSRSWTKSPSRKVWLEIVKKTAKGQTQQSQNAVMVHRQEEKQGESLRMTVGRLWYPRYATNSW
jgi:hypothetical protein